LPGLVPVSGENWEPRFDPVPALGEHNDAILAELGAARTAKGAKP
jgi:crotonobetainyl-CoA:carnitine CoA-transferase CaiB-like acyl-CoA transferase